MSTLEIRPHSRQVTGFAIAGLMLLGAGAFGLGLAHQLEPAGPSPFPPPQQPTLQIAMAAPAPEMQTATAVPTPVRRVAASTAPDASNAVGEEAQAPPLALTAGGADASAIAPDPSSAPAPGPQPAPPSDPDAAPQR